MTFVAPNILTDMNFAEIVEDETHPTHKMKEVLKEDDSLLKYKPSQSLINSISQQKYLSYKAIYESTHIMEYHCPPPNC